MILLASRQDDGSTCYVIEWLNALHKKYLRLDTDDNRTVFSHYSSEDNALVVRQGNKEYNLLEADSIWIRRNGFSMKNVQINPETFDLNIFFDDEAFHKVHMKDETKVLIEFWHDLIKEQCKTVIGSYEDGNVNKMKVLEVAKRHHLKTPVSYIVTRKSQLISILEIHPKLLTKALGNGVYRFTDEFSYYSYAEEVTSERIESYSDTFFPSLIQVEVKKRFELRVFYLMGEFYAMAIFSQQNDSTSLDFRRPNMGLPNRKVPYKLPKEVEDNLTKLMKDLRLNTGSIDMIVDRNGDYVFLEVNPVGQFSMTSYPCNYYLEKKIAEYL